MAADRVYEDLVIRIRSAHRSDGVCDKESRMGWPVVAQTGLNEVTIPAAA